MLWSLGLALRHNWGLGIADWRRLVARHLDSLGSGGAWCVAEVDVADVCTWRAAFRRNFIRDSFMCSTNF